MTGLFSFWLAGVLSVFTGVDGFSASFSAPGLLCTLLTGSFEEQKPPALKDSAMPVVSFSLVCARRSWGFSLMTVSATAAPAGRCDRREVCEALRTAAATACAGRSQNRVVPEPFGLARLTQTGVCVWCAGGGAIFIPRAYLLALLLRMASATAVTESTAYVRVC